MSSYLGHCLKSVKVVILPDPWTAPEPASSLPAFGARLGIGDDTWYDSFLSIGEKSCAAIGDVAIPPDAAVGCGGLVGVGDAANDRAQYTEL